MRRRFNLLSMQRWRRFNGKPLPVFPFNRLLKNPRLRPREKLMPMFLFRRP